MRRLRPLLLAASLLCAAGTTPDKQDFSQIERGKYLATLGDCAACHTAPGGQPFAGGRPIATPFGTIVSANITPDRDTGIGAWSDQDFLSVMQRGIGRGKHLYPAMPYPYYTRVTRNDDLAIRAWLATLLPVRHRVVSNRLPFPVDIRLGMFAWNTLFFAPGRFRPDPTRSAEWNRGAYLVQGLEHCGACHTPKDALGADDTSRILQGARVQDWFAPNITNDSRNGLGSWSVDDIVAYLRTGHNRVAAASGPMAEEVMLSGAQTAEADLRAVAIYLKSLPGQGGAGPRPAVTAASGEGAAIYGDECAACHGASGKGVAGLFPALNGAPAIQSRAPTSVIRVVLEGAKSAATDGAPTGAAMPAFGWMLSDAQVAAVTTYIRTAWGNAAAPVSGSDVRSLRAMLAKPTD